ncbi:hypothetical protein [Paraliobacillus sediminis]|uniref:hypothetical protein n=1 Tax=Paraliobacillus sediminis TaxID=1885916 RepID=UPI000E3E75C9|nr:hypothetical protein [Paraliobacillus sediminis]
MSKKYIIASIAVVILIIINLSTFFKLNSLDEDIFELDNKLQNTNFSIENNYSQVESTMNEMLEEQLWIQEKDYQIIALDTEESTVDVMLEWHARDLLQNEILSLLYRNENTTEWNELEVNNENGLNYSVEHTFPLRENYEVQLVGDSVTGKRSEELFILDFKDEIENRIIINVFVDVESDHKNISPNIIIYNHLDEDSIFGQNKDDLKIKSAEALIYVDGEIKKEINLLEEEENNYIDENSENINYYKIVELDEVIEDVNDIEVLVIVEDNLGVKYQTTNNALNEK